MAENVCLDIVPYSSWTKPLLVVICYRDTTHLLHRDDVIQYVLPEKKTFLRNLEFIIILYLRIPRLKEFLLLQH